MTYNIIQHEIRNRVGLSMIDYCLLESIYNLSTSDKANYNSWCNASKSFFKYLASDRTILNRFNSLEKNGWLEFKSEKRFLKRTTPKYYKEVYSFIAGTKKFRHEEVSPTKNLRTLYEEVSPLSTKQLPAKYEEVAPNKDKDNDKDKDIEKEKEKKALSQILELQKQVKQLEAEKEELKNKKEDPKESSEKEKVIPPPTSDHDQGAKMKVVKQRDPNNWTTLDMTLHNLILPKEWSIQLQENVKEYWTYMEEKKGVNWGTMSTIKRQRDTVTDFLKKHSDSEIIDSLDETIEKGNVTYNPQWTINRKEKAKGQANGDAPTFSFNQKITNG